MSKRASLKGWEECYDEESGRTYYFNPVTEESSWEHPRTMTSVAEVPVSYQNQAIQVTKTTTTTTVDTKIDIDREVKNIEKSERTNKYKAPESYTFSASKALQIAPLAFIISRYAQVLCICSGLIAIFMHEGLFHFPMYFGPGIYTTLIPANGKKNWTFLTCIKVIGLMNFMKQFSKVDKSTEAILDSKQWPKFITIPFDILLHHFTQGILMILISVYCFFCPQTCFAGAVLVLVGVLYLASVIHCEKPKKITGLV
eukprot:gene6800-10966_t